MNTEYIGDYNARFVKLKLSHRINVQKVGSLNCVGQLIKEDV